MSQQTTEQKVAEKVAAQPSIATKPATKAMAPWMGWIAAVLGLIVMIPEEAWGKWLGGFLPPDHVKIGLGLVALGVGVIKNWLSARKAATTSGPAGGN
jgi:hypothetical protein